MQFRGACLRSMRDCPLGHRHTFVFPSMRVLRFFWADGRVKMLLSYP
jgi:hypothetical protein